MHSEQDSDPGTGVDELSGDLARRLSALDTKQSFIVEASAGSGKTELLIQRYLKLLAQVDEPEEILAITFTKKATAEMRTRILQELRDAESATGNISLTGHKKFTRDLATRALQANREKRWNLIRQPERMNVRTIDSLCSTITARLPLLAGMGAVLQPVTDASALYYEAAISVLQLLGAKNKPLSDAVRTLLLHLDNRFENVAQLLANLLATRDHWVYRFQIGQELSDSESDDTIHRVFELPLESLTDAACARLQNVLAPESVCQIFSLIQYAAKNLKEAGKENASAACLQWKEPPHFHANDVSCWRMIADFLITADGQFRKRMTVANGFDTNSPRKKEIHKLLQSFSGNMELLDAFCAMQTLPPVQYSKQQKQVLSATFLLLPYALAELKLAFAQSGDSDFSELLLSAEHALHEDANSIALSLGTAIRHLLVDEMQDTSLTQFQMLKSLVQSWDGQSQTVFLVGDPKQSIYRFRQAEVGLFALARQFGLNGVHLEPIYLTSNFRSQQSLVETTNTYFSEIFSPAHNTDGISFQTSHTANLEDFSERAHWHTQIHPKVITRSTLQHASAALDTALVEAQQLCDVIEHLQAEDHASNNARSIAILVSNKRHATFIFREMHQRGIRYRAIEMDTLEDRQPLLDLSAIARCLLHAADRTAWLAVLRAPWSGLTLADLHTLCGEDDPQFRHKTVPELLRLRIELISEDGRPRAERVLRTFEKAALLLQEEPLSILVERVWHTLGGGSCIHVDEFAGVHQFFEMLHSLEEEGVILTAARIQQRMQKLYAPTLPATGLSVEVLTIHKAKGLEWDVVLLPGLHKVPRHDDPKLLIWTEEVGTEFSGAQESQFFLAPIKHASENSEPIGAWIQEQIAKRDEAERRRLFYVACTRARKELHFFASARSKENGELTAPNKRSLLQVAWPFAQNFFVQHPPATADKPAQTVLTMPMQDAKLEPTVAMNIAAEASLADVRTIPLSNFRRLPNDWIPATNTSDVLLPASPEWVDTEGPTKSSPFLRPEGSWKARIFGTVVHALMPHVAQVIRVHDGSAGWESALQTLREPALLRLMQDGYSGKDARASADRIIKILFDVACDPVAQWILGKRPTVDSRLPEFEVPLTALYENTIRSLRLDRMFLGAETPGGEGDAVLWIVDFKTSSHGKRNMAEFLESEKEEYSGQMRVYAKAVQAAYPQYPRVHLGLYFPLPQQYIWWQHGTDAENET